MPCVTLATARTYHSVEFDPCLSDEVCFFVIIEHGDFQSFVVPRLMDCKAKLLIPVLSQQTECHTFLWYTNHLGVCPPRLSVSVFFASFPSLAAQ